MKKILANRPSDREIKSRISKNFQALSDTAQFKIESRMGIDIFPCWTHIEGSRAYKNVWPY